MEHIIELSTPCTFHEVFDIDKELDWNQVYKFLTTNCLEIPWIYSHSDGFDRLNAYQVCIVIHLVVPQQEPVPVDDEIINWFKPYNQSPGGFRWMPSIGAFVTNHKRMMVAAGKMMDLDMKLQPSDPLTSLAYDLTMIDLAEQIEETMKYYFL